MATRYVWGRYDRNSTTTTTYYWNRYNIEQTSTQTGTSNGSIPCNRTDNISIGTGYQITNGKYTITGLLQRSVATEIDLIISSSIPRVYAINHSNESVLYNIQSGNPYSGEIYWNSMRGYIGCIYGEGGMSGASLNVTIYSLQDGRGSANGSVNSTNRSAYPDNGVSGNYWYVYDRSSTSTSYSRGSYLNDVSSDSSDTYPANSYSGSYCYTSKGNDVIDPPSVTYDQLQIFGRETAIQTAASTGNVYGGTITYDYQICVDGSSWVNVGSSTALSMSYTIPETATQFQARVRARDNMGFTSSTWITGPLATVRAPWVHHRLHRKNDQQVYNLVHFMTSAENVVHNNTSNVQATIDNIKHRLGLS